MARKFADEVVAPRARETDETEQFPADIVKQMCELGFMEPPYPRSMAAPASTRLLHDRGQETPTRAGPPGITSGPRLAGRGPVYAVGTEEQKQRLVPMAKGEAIGASDCRPARPTPPARRPAPSARTACGA
jgi:butyryl-CoA dehydrogenase